MKWFSFLIISSIFFLNTHSQARDLRVPDEYETLQLAIDDAQNGDVILLTPQHYYDCMPGEVTNKNLTIKSVASGTYPFAVLECDRFTPYIISVRGNSNVTIQNVRFIGGSRAISMSSYQGVFPSALIRQVATSGSVRGFFGQVNELTVENSGFNGNEGNGFILSRVKKLKMTSVSSGNNLNSGFVIVGAPGAGVEIFLNSVSASRNPTGGIWIHGVNGLVEIYNSGFNENFGFNMQITDSNLVVAQNVGLNRAEFGDLEFSADGLRISQSVVVLNNVDIYENLGKGIFAIGCESADHKITMMNVETRYSGEDKNWVSGQKGTCGTTAWNWLEIGHSTDQIFTDGLESMDSGGNTCSSFKNSDNHVCRATREDLSSSGFGTPPYLNLPSPNSIFLGEFW
jgi:hypothetical protein